MKPQPIKGKMPMLMSLLVAALITMWLVGRCSISHEKTIAREFSHPDGDTIAVAIEFAPTSYSLSGDSVIGFDYQMLKDIAEDHGINIVFHPFAPLDYALSGLRKGNFDMVIATVPASAELNDEFLLTDNIFVDRQVLVTRHDSTAQHSDYPPQMRMLGDTVWIPASSPFRDRIVNLSHEMGDTIYIKSDPAYNAEHLVILTALGEIRQAVVNEAVARSMVADFPNIDISIPVSMTQFQPWIVSSNQNSLRDSLNIWIEQYKQGPRYRELVREFLNK